MTNEKTNDDIIRIASIQLHYIPAWNVNYNCLTEPSGIVNIWKNEQTFSIIKQNLPSYTGIFDAFDELLINSYLEWLNNRIKSIFGFMEKTSLNPQIIVFPEYSIPFEKEIYNTLRRFSKNKLVIAGTHTTTKDDWAKTNEGLVFKNGERIQIEKLTLGKGEQNGQRGKEWKPVEFNGNQFGILFCSDFLQLSFDEYSRDIIRGSLGGQEIKDLHCIIVPSLSKEIGIFNSAKILSKHLSKKIPIIFINSSLYGGSRIFCNFDKRTLFHDMDSTNSIPKFEEAMIVTEINLRHQYQEKPESWYPLVSSEVLGVFPFLNNATDSNKQIEKLMEEIENLKASLQTAKSEIDKIKVDSILNYINKIKIENSNLLKQKLMYYRGGDFHKKETDYLLDYIPLDTPPFFDMIFMRVGKTIKLLEGIWQLSGPAKDDKITKQINEYKNLQLNWKEVEPVTKEKYLYSKGGCGSTINMVEAFDFENTEKVVISALSDIVSINTMAVVKEKLRGSPLKLHNLISTYAEDMINNISKEER